MQTGIFVDFWSSVVLFHRLRQSAWREVGNFRETSRNLRTAQSANYISSFIPRWRRWNIVLALSVGTMCRFRAISLNVFTLCSLFEKKSHFSCSSRVRKLNNFIYPCISYQKALYAKVTFLWTVNNIFYKQHTQVAYVAYLFN